MRAVFAIIIGLAFPLAAAAQTAGDRYGPTSAVRLNQAAGEAYQGRALTWANKQQAAGPAAAALPPPPTPYRQQPTYAPFQPQVPLPLQQPAPAPAASPQRLPTSIYGQAAPAPVAPAPAYVRPAPAAPAPMAAAPAPQRLAAAAPKVVGGPTRLYSVHRGYGMTPDAIPEPPAGDRYVLIGPPDGAADARTDDAPDARPGAF
ncbi:hypothetical protein [Phenylobacterium sp.]|uniref:hypothetical protein n=1 Tax=Phenylobacterium sp. TaxID=1871053 RepID=UPI00289A9D68|nr:hypothetical protein [Phenylobacterium sp.]